uniref:Uncharacterized protein n=3 Tax=Octopus bimaculoides TaxID=37653 RepID=A0A0L8FX82_OCTBM
MFDDYVLYLVENLHCQERASEFLRNIRQGDTSIVDFGEELMPSSLNFNDGLSSQSGNMTPPVGNSVQRPMERCSVITNGRDVMSQVGDYSCQRNVNEVSHVNQSRSPVHDNSQPVTIKSAYSPAADSSRSNSSNPSMQPSTQNALPVTPVNHISSCSPTYQQCQSYHMAYGQTLTNQHPVNMDTQNSHSMYSYDVSSQYPRHYLSAAAASVAPTEPIKTNVTSLTPTNRQNVLSSGAAAEWPTDSTASGSNRYNTPVMTHESVLRNNDNNSYTAYQTMRTPSATYDYSTYTYPDNYSRAAAVTVVPNTTPTPDAVSPHVYHPHHHQHHQHHQQQQQQQQQQQPTSYDGNAHMNSSSSTHNNANNSNSNSRSSSSNSNISNNSGSNNNTSNTNTNTTNSSYYDDSSRVDYCGTTKRKYESHQDTFSRHYKRYNREQYPYQVTSGGYM